VPSFLAHECLVSHDATSGDVRGIASKPLPPQVGREQLAMHLELRVQLFLVGAEAPPVREATKEARESHRAPYAKRNTA
jgi:hypothetical protein